MSGYEVFSALGSDTGVCLPIGLAPRVRDTACMGRYTRVLADDFVFGSLHPPTWNKALEEFNRIQTALLEQLKQGYKDAKGVSAPDDAFGGSDAWDVSASLAAATALDSWISPEES